MECPTAYMQATKCLMMLLQLAAVQLKASLHAGKPPAAALQAAAEAAAKGAEATSSMQAGEMPYSHRCHVLPETCSQRASRCRTTARCCIPPT